jgi:hypothetical protein
MPSPEDKPAPTRALPLAPRPLLIASVAMGVLAWLMFIVFQIAHRPAEPMLWILTAGWPFYYGMSLGIALGMISISRQGPLTSRWPRWIRRVFFPGPVRLLIDWFYAASGRVALVVFPLAGLAIGCVLVYLVITGQA